MQGIDKITGLRVIEPAVYPNFLFDLTPYKPSLDRWVGQEWRCEITNPLIDNAKTGTFIYCIVSSINGHTAYAAIDIADPANCRVDDPKPVWTPDTARVLVDIPGNSNKYGCLVLKTLVYGTDPMGIPDTATEETPAVVYYREDQGVKKLSWEMPPEQKVRKVKKESK